MMEAQGPEIRFERATGPAWGPEPLTRLQSTLPPLRRIPPRAGAPEEALRRNLRRSFGFHGFLLLAVILKSLVFPGQPRDYHPTLRVDLVDLPDQTKAELDQTSPTLPRGESAPEEDSSPPPPRSETAATEVADPKEMVLRQQKTLKERNRRRLEQLAREEKARRERENRMKAAVDRMKALAKIRGQVAPSTASRDEGILIRGNRISKGSSLSGDAVETTEPSYYDDLKAQLQKNWELPIWLERQKFSATVQVHIDSNGIIRSFRFTRPSGNAQFDDAVKSTVARSQPFPKPPSADRDAVLVHGISLGFPL